MPQESPSASKTSPLQDNWGRKMRKLRVSLLDSCQFRCTYCMPPQHTFLPRHDLLTPTQFYETCNTLQQLGVEEVRLTGGEPTLRSDLPEIVQMLGKIPWKRFGMTTNGQLLAPLLPILSDAGLTSLNISLDSLQEENFRKITGTSHGTKVKENILRAQQMGFQVKINTVVMRGINDHELGDFIQFSEDYGIPVRFLEVMKIGVACDNPQWFISADEMMSSFRKGPRTFTPSAVPADSTTFEFSTERGGQIGFIASESKPFCGTCSRLRLTAKGELRACLMKNYGLNVRDLPPEDFPAILTQLLRHKPTGRIEQLPQPMYQIGG